MTDIALQTLLAQLKAADYRFTTPAPSTHRRVLTRRAGQVARDLIDVFGWNMRFEDGLLPLDGRRCGRECGRAHQARGASSRRR